MFAIYKTITKKSIQTADIHMSISYIHILVIFIIKPLCLIRFQMRNKLIVSKKLLLINSKYLVWFSHLPDAGNGQKVVRIKV